MTPRRSSRARTTQPPPGPPTHTNSSASTSSHSLTRVDRNTRASHRPSSPPASSTHPSESPDATDSTPLAELSQPRRSRRGTEEKIQLKQPEDEDEDMDGVEEVTRCICGQPDYPGPPHTMGDAHHEDTTSDDVGNFFIQCDHCHVWQHGGCMGLTDESMTPDEYYCEQCKPDYHKVIQAPDGSKSTRYLPVLEAPSSRSSSLSTEESKRRDGKRNQSDASSTKRRATMNSRGAYDEDEMLRRAIEESKETGSTLGKRARDESEDNIPSSKRQRTSSSAESAHKRSQSQSPSQTSPDQDKPNTTNGRATQRRTITTRTTKENELRDKQKEQTALQRAEAANKRKARSERRRGDDSPPPTPSLSPAKAAETNASAKPGEKDKDETPPHFHAPRSNINNLRKKSTTTSKKGRLGRNQYTRDRDLGLNGDTSDTPGADSKDTIDGSPNGHHLASNLASSHTITNGQSGGGESGRNSKAKIHGKATSLNEMRRRVAGILEFVGLLQNVGVNGSGSGSGNSGGSAADSPPTHSHTAQLPAAAASLVKAVERAHANAQDDGDDDTEIAGREDKEKEAQKAFHEMGSAEMLELLMRECVTWQGVYGRYGVKEGQKD